MWTNRNKYQTFGHYTGEPILIDVKGLKGLDIQRPI